LNVRTVEQMASPDLIGIPTIPAAVLEAAKKGKLVLFVGAGVSQQFGLPSWAALAAWALEQLLQAGLLTFGAVKQLGTLDARKQLSIAMDIAAQEDFPLALADRLRCDALNGVQREYLDALVALSGVCVTTNYDLYLETSSAFVELSPKDITAGAGEPTSSKVDPLRSSIDPRDWIAELEKDRSVIHLHGSTDHQRSMIVSTRHYLKHYQEEAVRDFLGHLFRERTILFVGYGLEEIEIIEHLVHAATLASGIVPGGHYWLYPVLARDGDLLRHLTNYYLNQLGVYLVGYSIERRGYSELMDVIKAWSSQMPHRPRDVLDQMAFVSGVLADGADE
jgi:hypothetical protein